MTDPIFLDEVLFKLGFTGKVPGALMLSMDIAPSSTGWVLTFGSQLVAFGAIVPECTGHDRLKICFDEMRKICKDRDICWLVVEDYSGQRGWNNLQIGEVSGVIRLAYLEKQGSNGKIVYVSPKRLPSFIGKNKVEKKERILWVESIFPEYKDLIKTFAQRQKEDITDAMLITLLSLCARSYCVQEVPLNDHLKQILINYKPLCGEFK